jgi:hypothetical protein
VKKPDVIQKNELYFCNQGSNVIQNQLSKSKHRLKSFVLQACVILKNFSLNLLNKMFVLTEIIDCIFLLFSKILSPVLSISPLY